MDWRERIARDPNIRFGKPVVKGTRIAVEDVLGYLGAGDSIDTVLAEFPQLTPDDIRACFSYAADRERLTKIS